MNKKVISITIVMLMVMTLYYYSRNGIPMKPPVTKINNKMKSDGIHHNASPVTMKYSTASVIGNIPGNPQFVKERFTRKTKLPPLDKYWAKILHFVPEENSQNCLNLFTTKSSQSTKVTPEWEKLKGSMDMSDFRRMFTPQHVKQTLTYQELARLDFVHTVCEIGFNVGQSAITWLTTKPDLKLYSFDLGGSPKEKMGDTLEGLFPGRFKLTVGDSRITVPMWVNQGHKCDIVCIDGAHDYPGVLVDILNMRKAVAEKHIIVLDDIYVPGVNRAWKEMVNDNTIHHLFDCWIEGRDIDFALCYYKNVK